MLQEELSKLTLTELDKRDERQDVERVCVAITDVSHPILNNTQRFCDDLPFFVTRVCSLAQIIGAASPTLG